ncbi:NADP-dependent oxidoreductase [Andreprevotia chitinilytica]|uniref:NADP-dependent oxidoreductase n=1 Tax=Andreprevotia chitinilytica TaxID=396808 RepID=UPI0005586B6E|nr:NADP-dependent oxidoreductase [Andreprevotia chitinilytica]
MKAVRIHDYGDRSVLRFEEALLPTLGAEDVLIRVVATSINPVDWHIRNGHLQTMLPHRLPLTLGWDVSGVIEAVGAQVRDFQPGDAVYSRPDIVRDGAYAEYIAVRANEVAAKPKTISHIEAASLPLAGITAWDAIVKVGDVQAGQRVLVHAGSGGVGSLAVQLAKWRGAYVISTTSTPNVDFVKGLGADEVIDYRSANFKDVVRDVDLVFDTLGGQVQDDSWGVLKSDGLLVSVVRPPDQKKADELGVRSTFIFIQPDAAVLRELAVLVDISVVRPVVGAEFALKDIVAAHALSESGRARGKIAIYVGQP